MRDLTFGIVLATNVKFELRTELVMNKRKALFVTVLHKPITPAALSPYAAFGVLGTAASLLDSMGAEFDTGRT